VGCGGYLSPRSRIRICTRIHPSASIRISASIRRPPTDRSSPSSSSSPRLHLISPHLTSPGARRPRCTRASPSPLVPAPARPLSTVHRSPSPGVQPQSIQISTTLTASHLSGVSGVSGVLCMRVYLRICVSPCLRIHLR
jgi:hypothetical protein